MKKILFLLLAFPTMAKLAAQEIIPLYSKEIPDSKPILNREKSETGKDGILRISKVSEPTLMVFLPPKEKANGTAVIICPGGGYGILAASHEGTDVAKVFNEWGVTAFVLKYRLPDDSIMVRKEIGPLQDAQRAIQLVNTSLRPDFMILLYPVISFTDSLANMGSRTSLIGKNPTMEKINYYSNEMQVTKQTPPTFLVHAKDDGAVKVANSIAFYDALQKNGVPSEIHLYEKGGHGFGMNNKTSEDKWMDWLKTWMEKNGLLK